MEVDDLDIRGKLHLCDKDGNQWKR
ncbi:hypothetical protein MKW92_043296 [Papaver armeniacum]|nr:hypothetical protein MKW92_043296 [Papaver armeniacum]